MTTGRGGGNGIGGGGGGNKNMGIGASEGPETQYCMYRNVLLTEDRSMNKRLGKRHVQFEKNPRSQQKLNDCHLGYSPS